MVHIIFVGRFFLISVMSISKNEINILKINIEQRFGKKIAVSSDFYNLAYEVEKQTKKRISEATLKRLWEYVNDAHTPRSYTLDTLCEYCGFLNFEAFLIHLNQNDQTSGLLSDLYIKANSLAVNQRIAAYWLPDRKCVFAHMGNGAFVIESCENSKLKPGMTFRTDIFVLHHPLYMHDLADNHEYYGAYEAGRLKGLSHLEILTEE